MGLAAGTKLGPYEIVAQLGAGGMGEVYRARDSRLGREVAIKVLPEEFGRDPERRARFEREARAASAVSNAHVVTLFDIGRSGDVLYLVTELVEGTDLRSFVGSPVLTLDRVVELACQIATGLAEAHEKGIVHRDLKPENILVSKSGSAKIADFGLAKLSIGENDDSSQLITADAMTGAGTILGTIAYMSPEQARGLPVDFRSDQFALGSILYELVTGASPFRRDSPVQTLTAILEYEPPALADSRRSLPPRLERIVSRCLSKKPEGRYHSTRDLLRDLAEASHPVAAPPKASPVSPASATVGRSGELATIGSLLLRDDVRMLTLTGPAGVGKTRLALQAIQDLAPEFPGGIEFVSLAAVSDPKLLIPAIAKAFGVGEESGRPLEESLREALAASAGGRSLLVLDNFEHLVAEAGVIPAILAAKSDLKALVTSRSVLRLYGEQEFPVPALAVPQAGAAIVPAELERIAAVELFLQRVRAVKPDFSLGAENASDIAEICRRLEGLPLALELAAARVKLLSPRAILARLGNRLDLLTGGARDLPGRQQTLRAAIDWSHELLDEAERRLFRRLAAFAGGCTLEAVEAVCNARGDLGVDVLEGVASLAEKSLLLRREGEEEDPRFIQLETIREFGRERLEKSDEEDSVRRCHAAYFLILAEEGDAKLVGPEGASWYALFEREEANFRAASEWLARGREPIWSLRLGAAMFRYWERREYFSEGREQLESLLAVPGAQARTRERARTLLAVAILCFAQGDVGAGTARAQESLAIFREIGDRRGCVAALNDLAAGAFGRGDYVSASALFEEALSIWEELGDRPAAERTRMNLADTLRSAGETERARALFGQCLQAFTELSDLDGLAWTMCNLARMDREGEGMDEARTLLQRSLSLFEKIGDFVGVTNCLSDLSRLAAESGDVATARTRLAEGLSVARREGLRRCLARLADDACVIAVAEGRAEVAVRLAGTVEAFRRSSGFPRPRSEREVFDAALARAKKEMTEVESESAWRVGWATPFDDSVEQVFSTPPSRDQ